MVVSPSLSGASEILNDMADIRQYEHGFTMNCSVVFAASS